MKRGPRTGFRFANWARNHRCRPAAYHTPTSEDELRAVFDQARAERRTVRFVGAGHSWTDIACTDGHLVRLDDMAGLIAVDSARHRVTVEAGMRLHALSRVLYEHGLGMRTLGSISEQSVAGAISTGTHGTGTRVAGLAAQVTGLRLLTPAGDTLDLDDESDPERLAAARVSLGALGAITRVTLQCEPAYNLAERSLVIGFDRAAEGLDELAESDEHVKLWWLPHTDRVWLNRFRRTDEPATRKGRVGRWLEAHVVSPLVFPPLLRLGALAPRLIPSVNRLVAATHFKDVDRVDWAPNIFNVPHAPRHLETEWALPRAAAAGALRQLRALIADLGLRVNFIVEVRFSAADDGWLSPAYERDACHLGAYMYPARGWREYFDAFEALMVEHDGRPHWGKAYRFEHDYLRRVYPRFDAFDALRRELDPDGLLVNDFVARVFAP